MFLLLHGHAYYFLSPEKRWPRCSNQMDPGSSHMTSSDDVAGFDSPALFDSFEEMELHPLEHHRHLKIKRTREGENTRVRSKDITQQRKFTCVILDL